MFVGTVHVQAWQLSAWLVLVNMFTFLLVLFVAVASGADDKALSHSV